MAKLDHPPAPTSAPAPPPAPSLSRRLGLSSGVDRTKVRSLHLAPSKKSLLSTGTKSNKSSSSGPDPLATLARAARAILSRPPLPTPESLQALYALTEHVVHQGSQHAQQLYDRVRLEVERAAGDLRRELAAQPSSSSSVGVGAGQGGADDAQARERWIAKFDHEAESFARQVLLVRSVLLHLDRTFVLQSPALLSIWDLGLDLFQHSVLSDSTISSLVTSSTLDLIALERSGTSIPRSSLRSFLLRLRTLAPSTAFHALVVAPFLDATAAHFAAKGERLAREMEGDAGAYLRRVVDALREEGERGEALFGAAWSEAEREGRGEGTLEAQVRSRVEEGMIRGHVEEIATRETAAWCTDDRRDDLGTLYSLLKPIGALDAAALAIVSDASQDGTMVERLIALRHSARALVEGPFERDEDRFGRAVNSAFESAVNQRENKPAEMMAKYLDAKLRSGGARGLDDAALEGVLNDVLYLFRFTQGKDIFEAFYKRDLAKRLLLNKSASVDAERSMLLKLKDECGPGFTQKLEIMFKDMDLSADVMRAFSSSTSSRGNPFDLSVSVLSQGNWPSYPPFPVALPGAMVDARERFRAFYVGKHGGRTLTWAHGLDTVTLRAVFPAGGAGERDREGRKGAGAGAGTGGRKELLVSLAQAVVLLLFNDTAGQGDGCDEGMLSVEDIGAATQLDAKELSRTLQSLACGKVRVLTKHPKGRDVNPGDRFAFNSDFKSDHVRIKINQIQQKETVEENKSTTERVFTDRASHLQLAIVRIMKARKTLKHQELVMEVVSQIGQRFKVEPAEIKKSISSLIDREYLCRDEENQAVYKYLA
ncbi:Cullin family-domain-containing protein [Rhodotorula diobovata]|uniref:Cullin family-domain-containing protein n=1 Tax=Rhodotorula diobovata TaxID=5288 RepID=A0A5C5G2W3_9BASI|nr:Cullin family-domain-containing protein [Rhodotorula diobovata]